MKVELILLDKIDTSKTNPRNIFEKDKIEELKDSIVEHGLFYPIIVKPTEDGRYELIDGERRLKAHKLMQKEQPETTGIEALIANYKDAEEVQVVEHLQRIGLSPYEELKAVKKIFDLYDKDYENVAQVLGKRKSYVKKMIITHDSISKEALKLLKEGRIALEHAFFIASLDKKIQDQAIETLIGYDASMASVTPKEFKDMLEREIYIPLKNAPFSGQEKLGKQPICEGCEFNTAVNKELFDVKSDSHCLSPACYLEKSELKILQQLEDYKEKGKTVVCLFTDWRQEQSYEHPKFGEVHKLKETSYGSGRWEEANKKEATALGIIVSTADNTRVGTVLNIQPAGKSTPKVEKKQVGSDGTVHIMPETIQYKYEHEEGVIQRRHEKWNNEVIVDVKTKMLENILADELKKIKINDLTTEELKQLFEEGIGTPGDRIGYLDLLKEKYKISVKEKWELLPKHHLTILLDPNKTAAMTRWIYAKLQLRNVTFDLEDETAIYINKLIHPDRIQKIVEAEFIEKHGELADAQWIQWGKSKENEITRLATQIEYAESGTIHFTDRYGDSDKVPVPDKKTKEWITNEEDRIKAARAIGTKEISADEDEATLIKRVVQRVEDLKNFQKSLLSSAK